MRGRRRERKNALTRQLLTSLLFTVAVAKSVMYTVNAGRIHAWLPRDQTTNTDLDSRHCDNSLIARKDTPTLSSKTRCSLGFLMLVLKKKNPYAYPVSMCSFSPLAAAVLYERPSVGAVELKNRFDSREDFLKFAWVSTYSEDGTLE